MTDTELVGLLKRDVIDENLKYYVSIMQARDSQTGARDDLTVIYHSLPSDVRGAFVRVTRRVQRDTLSNVLGILDGSSGTPDYRGDFSLHYDNGQNLTGDLQDLFLSVE